MERRGRPSAGRATPRRPTSWPTSTRWSWPTCSSTRRRAPSPWAAWPCRARACRSSAMPSSTSCSSAGCASPKARPTASLDNKSERADAPWAVRVNELAVAGGTVGWRDEAMPRPVRAEITELKVDARKLDLAGKQPAEVQLSARLGTGRRSGGEPGRLSWNGSVAWAPLARAAPSTCSACRCRPSSPTSASSSTSACCAPTPASRGGWTLPRPSAARACGSRAMPAWTSCAPTASRARLSAWHRPSRRPPPRPAPRPPLPRRRRWRPWRRAAAPAAWARSC
jgi:hypothetical protein